MLIVLTFERHLVDIGGQAPVSLGRSFGGHSTTPRLVGLGGHSCRFQDGFPRLHGSQVFAEECVKVRSEAGFWRARNTLSRYTGEILATKLFRPISFNNWNLL